MTTEAVGFPTHEISTPKEPGPVEFKLNSEAPYEDVANVTVRKADVRIDVSERRIRKLARDGRLMRAVKACAEWLISTPVDVILGGRRPLGVAGRDAKAANQK